jgi:hypothetical protein
MPDAYVPARGQHGQSSVGGRGDLTGARYLANADRKADYDQAVKATRNALQDEQLELVDVGPRVYAIPKVAAEALRARND